MHASSSSHSSAPGRPASPYIHTGPEILVLRGPFANHVAQVIKTGLHGGAVKAVIKYGPTRDCGGKPLSLGGGDYVRTTSPTCPALPPCR